LRHPERAVLRDVVHRRRALRRQGGQVERREDWLCVIISYSRCTT
jgi:hypothetical protein